MLLVQLPAMDAVVVPTFPSLPSWPSFLSLASSASGGKPSLWVWLVLLVASLVILSTIRAVLLYIRPSFSASSRGKLGISIVNIASESKVPSGPTTQTVASVSPSVSTSEPKTSSPPSSSAPSAQDQSSKRSTIPKENKTSSWLFGLVKWDALPALPALPSLRQKNRNMLSISQTERGGWMASPPSHHMRQGSRSFNHPSSYSSYTPPGPPVSMAKMIMSRHTFRRPSSRPPPVRSASVVQYQRKMDVGGESV